MFYAALVAISAFAAFVLFLFSLAHKSNKESGQRALAAHLRNQLAEYMRVHGKFPSELSALQLSTFPAESTPATLHDFHYETNGETYTLTVIGASTGKTIVVKPRLERGERSKNERAESQSVNREFPK